MKFNIYSIYAAVVLFLGCMVFSSCEKEYEDIPYSVGSNSNTSGGSSFDHDDDDGDHYDNGGMPSNAKECNFCGGDGKCSGSNCNNGICIRCGGKGYTMNGKYKDLCVWCEGGKCPACRGTNRCNKCNGRGYVYN